MSNDTAEDIGLNGDFRRFRQALRALLTLTGKEVAEWARLRTVDVGDLAELKADPARWFMSLDAGEAAYIYDHLIRPRVDVTGRVRVFFEVDQESGKLTATCCEVVDKKAPPVQFVRRA